MELRVAFAGASGTGKSTLAEYAAKHFAIPLNPIGSRSVAKSMGYESPYDVDKAGRRAEFQRRLVAEKMEWEDKNASFVSDRTTLDNLAYTILHDVRTIDEGLLVSSISGFLRYTHVFYCPVSSFCKPGSDPARVKDMTYHEMYDLVLHALLVKYTPKNTTTTILCEGLDTRKNFVRDFITNSGS